MGNDSKFGMVIGLGVVVATAFMIFPKIPNGKTPAPESTNISGGGVSPRGSSSTATEYSLTSQKREKPATDFELPDPLKMSP
ncbi:hypothetical protein KIH39_24625 [Telmatocola sphagniphila]|uniref:Uncharacterized protein n=1 Tax=Telmatocola sphagniphila TaxID=1123043 RepID=A0A8E6B575_9BACT|nr:hypothetical protein [Telmatocola sphagniphila]QVL31981.1 hypothetical protein KIH39_24625 [Telmatocola sphagniphila]